MKRNDCSQPHDVKKEKNNILKALYSLGAPGIIDVETYLPSDDWTIKKNYKICGLKTGTLLNWFYNTSLYPKKSVFTTFFSGGAKQENICIYT